MSLEQDAQTWLDDWRRHIDGAVNSTTATALSESARRNAGNLLGLSAMTTTIRIKIAVALVSSTTYATYVGKRSATVTADTTPSNLPLWSHALGEARRAVLELGEILEQPRD